MKFFQKCMLCICLSMGIHQALALQKFPKIFKNYVYKTTGALKEKLSNVKQKKYMHWKNFSKMASLIASSSAVWYWNEQLCEQLKKYEYSIYLSRISRVLDVDFNTSSRTQTHGHLLTNASDIYCTMYSLKAADNSDRLHSAILSKKDHPTILEAITKAIKQEAAYTEKEYAVFYHAQRWNIYWLELVYTHLWQIKHQQILNNYLFTRFPKDGLCSENAALIEEQQKIRKELMERGRFNPHRPSLLFLNYALFGNTRDLGSSSYHYFRDNSNVSNPKIATRDIFKQFGAEALYDTNKEEFDRLEKEFLELSKTGNLLQIAVPKRCLEKYIYLAKPGGYKIHANIKKLVLGYGYNNAGEIVEKSEQQIRPVTDVAELIETIKHNPQAFANSDKKEFVLVVTADTVNEAIYDGVKMSSFNTADQDQVTQITDKLSKLIATTGYFKKRELAPWFCFKNCQNMPKDLNPK